MRRRPKSMTEMNFDSLVDIVTNSVGILIILAVFMALLSLWKPIGSSTEKKVENITTVRKILIPWAHYSQKSSLLLLLRDNKLVYIDRKPLYDEIINLANKGEKDPKLTLELDNYDVDLLVFTNYLHCMEFRPNLEKSQLWHKAKGSEGILQKLINENPREEFYFYVWVDSNSFELFREVREYLWKQNYEVGWKPVLSNSALRYCNGGDQTKSFQPQ